MSVGRLDGKVAIITGAAQGQGAAAAHVFAREGAKMVLTDINPDGGRVAEEFGDNAVFVEHDISQEDRWSQVIAVTLDRFGRIDALLNNAAYYSPKALIDTSAELMNQHYRVNQLGAFLGMKSAAPAMQSSGGGAIINVSSAAALRGAPDLFAYTMTKWAIRGMTKSAALEFAPLNIRVNVIIPGVIDTAMFRDHNTREFQEALLSIIPQKRVGKPEEVAELAAFLASDASAYINGAEITVDGAITV